ncbi:MAG: hypothetical protein OSB62_05690 [Alphaproteobacteria bacterium]|jgi:hypothetical protein|nr:hypothetical protein [Alphaproteobacteria bacterium]
MAKKRSGSTPTTKPQKSKRDKGFTIKLPDEVKPPRKGHKQGQPGAGAHKPKDQKGKPRQKGKADLKKGRYPDDE